MSEYLHDTLQENCVITSCLALVSGKSINKAALSISLANAKQLVIGSAPSFGWLVHIAGNSPADIHHALIAFAGIPGVDSVTPLALRNG